MKNLLRLEELAQFLVCLWYLIATDGAWWAYALLVIGPDIGMLGYLVNARAGAFSYNVLHHKGLAVLVLATGLGLQTGWFVAAGLILFGHASMDRVFGYGLKFGDNFHHTHLGWIGKLKAQEQAQQAIALAPAPAPELLQHRDELAPRPHGFAVLLAHHPADLVDMRQVVRGPCGDELMQPHFAEGGMDADAIQLRGGEV